MILREKGNSQLIICLPHAGTDIHPAIYNRLSATGKLQTDISWRLEQVVDFARQLDATLVRTTTSRFVIDVDQDPANPSALESARVGEALCPTLTFDQKRIYREGQEPGRIEVGERRALYVEPFYRAVDEEIVRLRKEHKTLVVLDFQSIRSRIRGYIEEDLPAISIGTLDDASCERGLRQRFERSFSGMSDLIIGRNQRFKGGYLTSRYGRPDDGLHAMSLVVLQKNYLRHETPPFEPDKARLSAMKSTLFEGFSALNDWARMRDGNGPEGRRQEFREDETIFEEAEIAAVASPDEVSAAELPVSDVSPEPVELEELSLAAPAPELSEPSEPADKPPAQDADEEEQLLSKKNRDAIEASLDDMVAQILAAQ